MSRWVSFAIFLSVSLVVIGAWHWYLWLRLVRDPGWPPLATRVGTVLIWALAASMPLGLVASRLLPPRIAEPIAMGVYLWMGASFLLLVIVGGLDVARLTVQGGRHLWELATGGGRPDPVDPARRLVLARSAAAAAGVGAGLVSLHGLRGALGEVETREVEVPLERLPAALEGMTIVQLTDVHVGPLIGRRFVEGVAERVNALRPDVVVITGDLVDGSPDALREAVAPLGRLGARWGTFFVTGNHEYYSGVVPWMRALERMGIQVLENRLVRLGDRGPKGASFDLVGIPDPTGAGMGPAGPDLAAALDGRDPERELILLAHQPKQIAQAAGAGVGLTLSGHTHGGQIWPFGALVALAQPYVSGLHRHDDGWIYVSRGTGFWGPPMRVGAPAEITRIVLKRA